MYGKMKGMKGAAKASKKDAMMELGIMPPMKKSSKMAAKGGKKMPPKKK
jgi:hypothetical protein